MRYGNSLRTILNNMLDINSSCRTCMKSSVNLVNLYEPTKIDENSNIQLAELLLECAAIQVDKNDGLPPNLCNDCIKILHQSYTFRSQAAKAEQQFKLLLQENVKTEIKAEHDPAYFDDYDDYYENELKMELEDLIKPHEQLDIKSDVEIYTCLTCNKTYTEHQKYLKHLDSHKSNYACTFCKKAFNRETSLKKHKCKHMKHNKLENESLLKQVASQIVCETIETIKTEEDKPLSCDECGKIFNTHKAKVMHEKKHIKVTSFTCDVCGKGFVSKAMVKRHLRLHNNEKQFNCKICSKAYSRSDQLKVHLKTHSKQRSNVCPYCNKAFTQVCSLKDHIRTHTGETPYLCSECGRGFANSSNLRQHMIRHTGLKPHACKLCPKTFCTKGQMTTHMVTHTGAHPYECDKCGASFTKPTSLKKHDLIHTGQRPYGCDTCPMRFTCKDHLKRHNRIHTGEKPYKCRYCERAFTQSNDLVKHMRGHLGQNIYDCSVCGLRFRLKSELKKHYPVHFINDEAAKELNIDNALEGHTDTQKINARIQDSLSELKATIESDIEILKDKKPYHIQNVSDIQTNIQPNAQTKTYTQVRIGNTLADIPTDLHPEKAYTDMQNTLSNIPETYIIPDSEISDQTNLKQKIGMDKFMITINSTDDSGMVSINIEPQNR